MRRIACEGAPTRTTHTLRRDGDTAMRERSRDELRVRTERARMRSGARRASRPGFSSTGTRAVGMMAASPPTGGAFCLWHR